MTEHLCVICPKLRPDAEPRIYDRRHVCEGCRTRLRSILAEIVDSYAMLDDELVPGRGWGPRVSGSRNPPLPLREDPLDLTLAARVGVVHDGINPRTGQPYGDQVGLISVAAVLDSWVRDWRDVLCPREGLPQPFVTTLVSWLGHRLDDACSGHTAVHDFAGEMHELAYILRRTVGTTEVRPEPLAVPCRRCDLLTLQRLPGQDRVECSSCGDLLTEDEYRRWCGLLARSLAA